MLKNVKKCERGEIKIHKVTPVSTRAKVTSWLKLRRKHSATVSTKRSYERNGSI